VAQFVNVQQKDLGAGIDRLSSETNIPEGYSEKLVNWEPTPEGYLKKRTGYETVNGRLPVRVHSISPDFLKLNLDEAIDVTRQGNTPILVGGFNTSGTFASETITDYSIDPRVIFSGTETELISAVNSGLVDDKVSIQFIQADDGATYQEVVYPDEVIVDTTTYEVSVTVTEGLPTTLKGYLAFKERGIVGESYVSGALPTGGLTRTVSAATHSLNTTSLQVEYYVVDGAAKRFIYPDSVVISPSDVVATFTEDLANVYAIISRASGEFAQNINSGSTTTTSFFDIDTEYPITQAWLVNNDGTREKAVVDSVELDQANKQMRFTVQNNATAISLIITWESGTVVANSITLPSPGLAADKRIGTLIWGLNQNLAYDNSNSTNRSGWVNFVDGYRKESQEYVIAGTDRELFAPSSSTNLSPTLSLSSRGRSLLTDDNQLVGPAFIGPTSPTPSYANYVVGAGGESGWLKGNTGTYVAGLGYRFSVAAASYTGTLVGQYATIQKSSAGLLNGNWKILAATFSAGIVNITLETPQISNEDWDGATCLIGIFSATVNLDDSHKTFLNSDVVNNFYVVKSVAENSLILDGFTDNVTLIAGTPIYVTYRAANSLVPLRVTTGTDAESADGILVGDSLTFSGVSQQYEVLDLVTAPSTNLGTVTASVASGVSSTVTSVLRKGQKVLITGAYSGVATIASLTSTTITFEETVSGVCFLVGKTVEVTRPIYLTDTQVGGNLVSLQPRWAPLARPDASALPFSNSSQFGLSSMSNDSLYVVSPEVTSPPLKWDGVELTRAGVPRWPLTAFITLESNGSVGPGLLTLSVSWIANNNFFTLTTHHDKNKLKVGTVVKTPGGNVYTIEGYETITSPDSVRCYVNIPITDATNAGPIELKQVTVVNYYYRLKKTDSNGFETVGAVYGSQELNVRLDVLTNIWHKVILPPNLQFTNKARYELEVYRTKGDAAAPYYLTNRIRISPTDKYLTFVDKNPDLNLEELDNISTSLLGAEVGISWEDLPQGNSFTTAGNRSIVANIRSRPQLELQFNSVANTDVIANMDLTRITVGALTYEFTDTASATTITGWTNYNNTSGVATITTSGTALSTGQKVYIGAAATATTRYPYLAGWYTMLSATTIQLEAGLGSPTLTDFPPNVYVASSTAYVPVFIGTDFIHSALGTEKDYSWYESIRRLAMAIRATSSITAEAGDSFDNGYLKLQSDTPFDVVLRPKSAFVTSFKYAVGGQNVTLVADTDSNSSAVQELFPSRLVYSYPNYPEVLDACFVASDLDSDNVIDVNASDGQEITAIQPFFGETAFGGSTKEGVILVLKTNSAYVVDLNAKKEGRNAVQKLDTQGLGCEYPRTLSPIRNGLQFANRAGVWKITQDLRFMFAGRKLSNLWEQDLLPLVTDTDIPCAHNSRLDSRWRLILDGPSGDGVSYNHLREYLPDGYRDGSWMQLASYPGLGFANLSSNSFMASDKNRVSLLLTSAFEEPFYDAGEAIYSEAILAAQDFGDNTRRKSVQSFQLVLRTDTDLKGLEVSTATEMRDAYVDADSLQVTVVKPTGLSDQPNERIQAFLFNSTNKRGTYFQLRLIHQATDEAPEILAVSYKVAGLTDKGVTDAKQSK